MSDHGAMLRHADIWSAIDELARAHGLSPSGLARAAGLDPTTFNRSKRITREGKPRWPSTESIAKILDATATPLAVFVAATAGPLPVPAAPIRQVPLIALNQTPGAFDAHGQPQGGAWDVGDLPDSQAAIAQGAFLLEVTGDALLPVYRDGDRLLVAPTAPTRRGDRVVVHLRDGTLLIRTLGRETATRVELLPLAGPESTCPPPWPMEAIQWVARVLWASQ